MFGIATIPPTPINDHWALTTTALVSRCGRCQLDRETILRHRDNIDALVIRTCRDNQWIWPIELAESVARAISLFDDLAE